MRRSSLPETGPSSVFDTSVKATANLLGSRNAADAHYFRRGSVPTSASVASSLRTHGGGGAIGSWPSAALHAKGVTPAAGLTPPPPLPSTLGLPGAYHAPSTTKLHISSSTDATEAGVPTMSVSLDASSGRPRGAAPQIGRGAAAAKQASAGMQAALNALVAARRASSAGRTTTVGSIEHDSGRQGHGAHNRVDTAGDACRLETVGSALSAEEVSLDVGVARLGGMVSLDTPASSDYAPGRGGGCTGEEGRTDSYAARGGAGTISTTDAMKAMRTGLFGAFTNPFARLAASSTGADTGTGTGATTKHVSAGVDDGTSSSSASPVQVQPLKTTFSALQLHAAADHQIPDEAASAGDILNSTRSSGARRAAGNEDVTSDTHAKVLGTAKLHLSSDSHESGSAAASQLDSVAISPVAESTSPALAATPVNPLPLYGSTYALTAENTELEGQYMTGDGMEDIEGMDPDLLLELALQQAELSRLEAEAALAEAGQGHDTQQQGEDEAVVLTIPIPAAAVPSYPPRVKQSRRPKLVLGPDGHEYSVPSGPLPGSCTYQVVDEDSCTSVPVVVSLPPADLGVSTVDIRTAATALGLTDVSAVSQAAGAAIQAAGIPIETKTVDYAPITAVHPIDMEYVPRAVRTARKIRLAVCITCYNEEGSELQRTLAGVALNLPKLAREGLHWSEVAVVIVLDGRAKMHPTMQAFLEGSFSAGAGGMHLFKPDLVAPAVGDVEAWPQFVSSVHEPAPVGLDNDTSHENKGPGLPPDCPVTMHVFERTVALGRARAWDQRYAPLQLTVAVKERNAGKLNSHLWFFAGFCTRLNPKYTLLLDCGTVPRPSALARFYRSMEQDPSVGGCCGEIVIRGLRPWHPVEAAQAFEYSQAHSMEKTTESALGLIGCLPGAFSMYRWFAIRGEPLVAYFKLEEEGPIKEIGPFTANMYLAEDRILAAELMAKKGRAWGLRFYADAVAETDCPDSLVGLLKQRRRWLNGTFFALVYVLSSYKRFFSEARHNWGTKIGLLIQLPMLVTSCISAWFGVGLLYLTFLLVAARVANYGLLVLGASEIITVFQWGYVFILFLQLLVAFGAGSGKLLDSVAPFYLAMALVYGLLMYAVTALGVWLVATGGVTVWVALGICVSAGAVLLSSFLHGSLYTIVVTAPQYLALSALFINVFPIFSFANAHDVSWGTRDGALHVQQQAAAAAQEARVAAQRRLSGTKSERIADSAGSDQGAAQEAGQAEGGLVSLDVITGTVATEDDRAVDISLDSVPRTGSSAARSDPSCAPLATPSTTTQGAHGRRGSLLLSNGMGGEITPGPLRARVMQAHEGRKSIAGQKGQGSKTGGIGVVESAMALAKRKSIEADKAAAERAFALFRLRLVAAWVGSNTLLCTLIQHFDPTLGYFALAVVLLGAYSCGLRLIGTVVYYSRRAVIGLARTDACFRCCYRLRPQEDHTPASRYRAAMAVAWQGAAAVGAGRVGAGAVREAAMKVYRSRQQQQKESGEGDSKQTDQDVPDTSSASGLSKLNYSSSNGTKGVAIRPGPVVVNPLSVALAEDGAQTGAAGRTGRQRATWIGHGALCGVSVDPYLYDDAWEEEHPYPHEYPLPEEYCSMEGMEEQQGESTSIPAVRVPPCIPAGEPAAAHGRKASLWRAESKTNVLPPASAGLTTTSKGGAQRLSGLPPPSAHRRAGSLAGSVQPSMSGGGRRSLVPDAGYDPDAVKLQNRRAALGRHGSVRNLRDVREEQEHEGSPGALQRVQPEQQFITIVLNKAQLPK